MRQVIAKLFLTQLDYGLHLFLGDVDAARLQDVLRGRGTLRGPLRRALRHPQGTVRPEKSRNVEIARRSSSSQIAAGLQHEKGDFFLNKYSRHERAIREKLYANSLISIVHAKP